MFQTRRNFLKSALAAAAAGATLGTASPGHALGHKRPVPAKTEFAKGYCPFCQVRCTYQARIEDGKIVSIAGEKNNHWTGGAICPKGYSMIELLDSPWRITQPMLKQEDGSWKTISYQEAVDLTAQRLDEVRKKHGDKSGERVAMTMPLWDCLDSEIAALMLLRCVGSVHAMPPGETCVSTASNMLGSMIGVNSGSTQVDELPKTDLIVLWGANVNELYPSYTRWLKMARDNGVKIIYIDPRLTRTSRWATTQLRPQPGTDGVLARGALRHIVKSGAFNEDQASKQIADLDKLAQQVEKFTPEFVAATTGLSQEDIENFYKELASAPKSIAWLGGSLSRQTNGIGTTRAIILLQALTDNLIGPGKGILTFQSGKPGGAEELVDHYFGELKKPKMNFRRLRNAMEKNNLDILFLNSSYRRNPDALGVRKAIEKVPFVVHMAFFPDEEMEVSDLIIPAAFGPESQGVGYGNENQVAWREKLVEAPGACVSGWQFYRDVGRKLEPEKYPDFKDPEQLMGLMQEIVPSWKGITLQRLRSTPTLTWPIYEVDGEERKGSVFTEGKMLTPSGKMFVVDSVFGGLDKWDYPKSHPKSKDGDKDFPLILTQGKELWHWQQTLTNFARSMAQFSDGRYVRIHPETARQYGLKQKDQVLLETKVGSLPAWVDISDTVLPGVVFTPAHCSRTTPLEENKSPSICNILPNYWDRISAQHNGGGCRLKKV